MFGQHCFPPVLVYQDKLPGTAAVPAHHTVCCTGTGAILPAQSKFTMMPAQSWVPHGSLCSIPLPLISFLLLRQWVWDPPRCSAPQEEKLHNSFEDGVWRHWNRDNTGGGEKAPVPYPQLESAPAGPAPSDCKHKALGKQPAQHSEGEETSGSLPAVGMSLPRLCT